MLEQRRYRYNEECPITGVWQAYTKEGIKIDDAAIKHYKGDRFNTWNSELVVWEFVEETEDCN